MPRAARYGGRADDQRQLTRVLWGVVIYLAFVYLCLRFGGQGQPQMFPGSD